MPNPAAALPWLGLGLGVHQTISGERRANQAIQLAQEEANKPRLSPQEQARLRSEGGSNLKTALAQRGLSDSSLLSGGIADLETRIAEAAAPGSRQSIAPELMWRQAMGESEGGGAALGSLAEMYMLEKFMRNQPTPTYPGFNPPNPSGYDYNPGYPGGSGWGQHLPGKWIWTDPPIFDPTPFKF